MVLTIILLFTVGIFQTTNELIINNLLKNGNFNQLDSDGRPSNWNVNVGQGNTSIKVLQKNYLDLNAVELITYTNQTSITLSQTIQLEQNTNKSVLIISFWHTTWIIYSSGSVRLEYYDQLNRKIHSENVKSLASNTTWTHVQIKMPIYSNAVSAKILIRMHNCVGKFLMANFSIEQIDSWKNKTFFVSPKSDGTIFIQWNLSNHGINVTHYDIYRGEGVLSVLNDTHLMVTIPTMLSYGKNIYESMYTDHSVRLNTIYTYQVIARDATRKIIDQTMLKTGQADLNKNYYDITTLIALPRINSTHLSWRLKATSMAKYINLYNGINDVSDILSSNAKFIGRYPVEEMKAIVSPSNLGPFLLISDDGNDIATAKLANLNRPRIILTPTHLSFIREKVKQPGHAQEVLKALIKNIYKYQPNNSFNYVWPAREAALVYAITGNTSYIYHTYSALNASRRNYTVYDRTAIKLIFAHSTMARAQAFDWAYDAFNVEQRQELMNDFLYAASIFTSYSDDHSHNPNDKASNWVAIVKSSELILHLTLYGEQGYPNDQAERRILFLLNELKLHMDHAYGPSGYMQEGLSYLSYTIPVLAPAVYLAKDMGISTFDEVWFRPDWHNLALHTISLRKQRNSLQFGVSDSAYSYNGFLPHIFNSTNDISIKAALRWLYDRTMGINSYLPAYDAKDRVAALLYYPYDIPAKHPSIVFPRSTTMIADNIDGFYEFRNRYQDVNDVLIALISRNRCHSGWNANETFALSIISHDTTWARMPGKEFHNYGLTRKFSTPLIDGWPREPRRGRKGSYTKSVKAFDNQGGGYVSIDASINFNIVLAQRDIFVDMIPRDNIDTILALEDQFIDTSFHSWHWQLSPDPTETNITLGNENNLSTFTIRGRNNSWLKGWLYNYEDAVYNNTKDALRIIKYGFSANFKIVMALGMGTEPVAIKTASGIRIDNAYINFDRLSQGVEDSPSVSTITTGTKTLSIIIITVATTIASIMILFFIGVLLRKRMNKIHRVNSMPLSPIQKFTQKQRF